MEICQIALQTDVKRFAKSLYRRAYYSKRRMTTRPVIPYDDNRLPGLLHVPVVLDPFPEV